MTTKLDLARSEEQADPRIADLLDSVSTAERMFGSLIESPGEAAGAAWFHGLVVGLALSGPDADDLLDALRRHRHLGGPVEEAGVDDFTANLRRTAASEVGT